MIVKFHPLSFCSRIVSHLAVFAVMLTLAAQPAHLLACCVSSSFQPDQHSNQHADTLQLDYSTLESVLKTAHASHAIHADGFVITTGAVEATHHHHVSCCENCDFVVQAQKTTRSEFSQAASIFTRVEPVFVFDVGFFAHRPTRAGPPDARVVSIHLSSFLLGRAPPLSI